MGPENAHLTVLRRKDSEKVKLFNCPDFRSDPRKDLSGFHYGGHSEEPSVKSRKRTFVGLEEMSRKL